MKLLLTLFFLAHSFCLFAADKNGTAPQVLSLPSGPGSFEGLGENFDPLGNTGNSSAGFKIKLPPARAGLAPDLSLSYSSAAGNGVLGLGWSMSTSKIHRRTDRGTPTYSEEDTFLFNGEPLVELADGTWRVQSSTAPSRFEVIGNYWVQTAPNGTKYYYGLNSGSGVQPRLVSPNICAAEGSFGFTQDDNNVISTGTECSGEISQQFNSTFEWRLSLIEDPNGNQIEYLYTTKSDSPGQLYLKEIRYSELNSQYQSVEFDYESRVDVIKNYRPGFLIQTAQRLANITTKSLGSYVREYEIDYNEGSLGQAQAACHTQDDNNVISTGTECSGEISQNSISLITSITEKVGDSHLPPNTYTYTKLALEDQDNFPFGNFPGAEDSDLNGNGVQDSLSAKTHPNAPAAATFQAGLSEIMDVNADGLPDILRFHNGKYYWAMNLGAEGSLGCARDDNNNVISTGTECSGEIPPSGFAAEQEMTNHPQASLADAHTLLADIDGDGRTDLVTQIQAGTISYFQNYGDGSWSDRIDIPGTIPMQLGAADTRLIDLNGDRIVDFLRTNANGTWNTCLSQNQFDHDFYPYGNFPGPEDMDWENDGTLDPTSYSCSGAITSPLWSEVIFQNTQVKLADFNGDRLQDFWWFRQQNGEVEVLIWMSKGNLQFADPLSFIIDANSCNGASAGNCGLENLILNQLQIHDLNGDGLSDLVQIQPGFMLVAFNQGSSSFSNIQKILGTPNHNPATTSFRFTDINGNGSVDPVWIRADQLTDRIQYLDFTPQGKAGLLLTIDQGLGKRTTWNYAPSTAFNLNGDLNSPIAQPIVTKRTIDLGLEVYGVLPHITQYHYQGSWFDPYQQEFRGFKQIWSKELGEVNLPSRVTRNLYHLGNPDGVDNDGDQAIDERVDLEETEELPLKGMLIRSEQTTEEAWNQLICHSVLDPESSCDIAAFFNDLPNNLVFNRINNLWSIKRIHSESCHSGLDPESSCIVPLSDSKEVSLYLQAEQSTLISELGNGTAKTIRTTYKIDNYGNQIEVNEIGDVDDVLDNVTTKREFAINQDLWLVSYPKREQVLDNLLKISSDTKFYYDGSGYQSLSYGTVEKGLQTKVEAWVKQSQWITRGQSEYDAYGNKVGIKDGLGNERRVEYDADLKAMPVAEVLLGTGSFQLRFESDVDLALGTVNSMTDPNGNQTRASYDRFGRIVKLIKPGDSEALPTQSWQYFLNDAHSTLSYIYDETGGLSKQSTSEKLWKIKQETREESGKEGAITSWRYLDGWGREWATLEEEVQGFAVTAAKTYGRFPQALKEFQPYFTFSEIYSPIGQNGSSGLRAAENSEFAYDALARVIQSTTPPDVQGTRHSSTTSYFPLKTELINAKNQKREQLLDGRNRLKQLNEYIGGQAQSTQYFYHPSGNLSKVVDPLNNQRSFTYDGLARKIRANDPDKGLWFYQYDAADNLKQKIDSRGWITSWTHDAFNRPKTESFQEYTGSTPFYNLLGDVVSTGSGESSSSQSPFDNAFLSSLSYAPQQTPIRWFYDVASSQQASAGNLKGKLSHVEDQSGFTYFAYDERGNLQDKWFRYHDHVIANEAEKSLLNRNGSGLHFRYTYNARDQIKALQLPEGSEIRYEFDARGRVKRIPGIIDNVVYNAASQILRKEYVNGVTALKNYDPRLRLLSLQAKTNAVIPSNAEGALNTGIFQKLSYTWDAVDNIASITDNRDLSGSPNVIPSTEGGLSLPEGSLQTNPNFNESESFQYDDLNRLTAANGFYGFVNYQYDAIGNITQKTASQNIVNLGLMNYGGNQGKENRSTRFGNPGPHTLTSTANGIQQKFDFNGSLKVKTVAAGFVPLEGQTEGELQYRHQSFTWNWRNRMSDVLSHQSTTVAADYVPLNSNCDSISSDDPGFEGQCSTLKFLYDYEGQRKLKRDLSVIPGNAEGSLQSTYYVDKSFELRPSKLENGSIKTKQIAFVFLGSQRVASIQLTDVISTDCNSGTCENVIPSEAEGSLRSQTLRLKQGWNLISFHIELDETLPENVFAPIQSVLEEVTSYDKSQERFRTFNYGAASSLFAIEPLQGYWLKVSQDIDWIAQGKELTKVLNLESGWNLVGFPITSISGDNNVITNNSVIPAQAGISCEDAEDSESRNCWQVSYIENLFEGNLQNLWSWDESQQSWQVGEVTGAASFPSVITPFSEVEAGKAYWVSVANAQNVAKSSWQNQTITFYHENHLGSTYATTNNAGKLTSKQAYFPYGLQYAHNNTVLHPNDTTPLLDPKEGQGVVVPYTYTGKEFDSSDLYYFEARYYDPLTSRFASIDPMVSEVSASNHNYFNRYSGSSQEQNFYMYTGGNSVNRVDSDGLKFKFKGTSEFKARVNNMLTELSKTSEGNRLVSSLKKSEKIHTFYQMDGELDESYNPRSPEVDAKSREYAEKNIPTGSDIYLNSEYKEQITSEEGNKIETNEFFIIGHELKHSYNLDIGKSSTNLIREESSARHSENLIRAEKNAPLRAKSPLNDKY